MVNVMKECIGKFRVGPRRVGCLNVLEVSKSTILDGRLSTLLNS